MIFLHFFEPHLFIFWNVIIIMDAINNIIMLHHHSICIFFISLKAFFLFISLTQNRKWIVATYESEKGGRIEKNEKRRTARHVPKLSTFMISSEYYIDTKVCVSLKSLFSLKYDLYQDYAKELEWWIIIIWQFITNLIRIVK